LTSSLAITTSSLAITVVGRNQDSIDRSCIPLVLFIVDFLPSLGRDLLSLVGRKIIFVSWLAFLKLSSACKINGSYLLSLVRTKKTVYMIHLLAMYSSIILESILDNWIETM